MKGWAFNSIISYQYTVVENIFTMAIKGRWCAKLCALSGGNDQLHTRVALLYCHIIGLLS